MADPGHGLPDAAVSGYLVGMTEPAPEPTLSDVLAALSAIAQAQAEHGTALAAAAEKLDDVETKVDMLGQDVMAVKVDTGFIDRHIGDFQAWARRHESDPNAHRPAA